MQLLCRLVGFAALVFVGSGCASSPSHADQSTQLLQKYAQALRNADAALAWSMVDEDAKRETSFEAFRNWLINNPADATELADAIERPNGPASTTVEVPVPGEPPVLLTKRDGNYKIYASSLNLYSQLSPELALSAFVRAVRNRRLDVLMRLAPESKRRQLSEESLAKMLDGETLDSMLRLVRGIELALPSNRLKIDIHSASLDLGAGAQVTLVLENGVWKVEDYLQ